MFNDILVAVDLNYAEEQRAVLEVARELAVVHGSRLHVVSIIPDIASALVGINFSVAERKRVLEQVNTQLHAYVKDVVGDSCPVQHIVDTGKVYEEVLLLANKLPIDLIVMGAHQPALSDYLLGSNSARVVRHATCSVFIVRPSEVVSE